MHDNIYEQLMHQFRHSFNLIRRSFHVSHSKHEESHLHDGQGMLLRILERHDGITQKDLAEMLQIRPPSLSELVSKLEGKGCIQKLTNEEDKRISNIKLTQKGHAVIKQVREERADMSKEFFSALSEDEQKQLLELLTKINSNLTEKDSHVDGRGMHGRMHRHSRHFRHGCGRKEHRGHGSDRCDAKPHHHGE